MSPLKTALASLLLCLASCAPAAPEPDGGRDVQSDAQERAMPPGCDNPLAPRGLGVRCACDTDCESALRCQLEAPPTGLPGGLCTRSCELDRDCAPAGRCFAGQCLAACTAPAQCEPGRACFNGSCFPWCTDDTQCRAGVCNRYTGRCQADTSGLENLRDNNAACTASVECRSGLCATGYCVGQCLVSRQDCPNGDVCARSALSVRPIDQGFCSPACTAGDPCPMTGTRCGPTPGVPGEPSSCRP